MVAADNLNNNANDLPSSDVGLIDTRSDADQAFGDVLSQLYTPGDKSNTQADIGDTLIADNGAGVSSATDAAEVYGVDSLGLPIIEITGMDTPFQNVSSTRSQIAAVARAETQAPGRVAAPEVAPRTAPESVALRDVSPAGPTETPDLARPFIERAAIASVNPENMREKLLTFADRLS